MSRENQEQSPGLAPPSRRIAVCIACVAVIALVFIAWWVHSKATERKSLAAASASRIRAEQGDAKAQFELGSRYYYGRGVPQNYAEALRWYRKAAEQGDAKAQSALGYVCWKGEAVPQDYAEAVRWYRKAAEQGYPSAQMGLGFMYANGQGVPQDDTQAVAWYRKAAEQGDAVAQRSLGYMYASGLGVARDRVEAVAWYRKAAEQGDLGARQVLESAGRGTRPPIRTRYIELSTALLGFAVGFWCIWSSLRLRDWRRGAEALLGVVFVSSSGLSLYAFAHDIRYSPYHDAFHLARKLLVATAILLIVTVALAKKKSNALPG